MCVIIVKDKNGVLPKKEALKNCFDRNSDGAGFMYVESGKVVIDKGYMNFKSFYKHFKRLCKKFNNFENKNLVMHMRIATSGGVNRGNTHPFPIEDNYQDMLKLYFRTDVGLAHNGVISAAKPTRELEDIQVNDTMLFIKAYLNNVYEEWNGCFDNNAFLEGIKLISSSKFAILDKNDTLRTIGKFEEFEGVKYSNTSYEPYVAPKYSNYSYRSYDYDGYEQYGVYPSGDYKYNYDYDYYDDDYNYSYKNDYDNYEKENIVLEDCDLIALSYDGEYVRLETLRTEKDSIFIFDKIDCVMKEMTRTGKVLKKYEDVFVYDESEKVLY